MVRQINIFIATGAYSGFSPIIPGTAGSAVGLLIYFLILGCSPAIYLAITAVIFLVGVYAATMTEAYLNKKDPREVVIDEIAGMLVTMFMIPECWEYVLAGFVLFRILDVVKPFIKWAEKIKNGWGIMLDDILAGIMANLILHGYILFFP